MVALALASGLPIYMIFFFFVFFLNFLYWYYIYMRLIFLFFILDAMLTPSEEHFTSLYVSLHDCLSLNI
jgi:hypothetical protein